MLAATASRMQFVTLGFLYLASVGKAQTTCGTIRDLYKDEGCCGSPSKVTSYTLQQSTPAAALIEEDITYMDGNVELHGKMIYEDLPNSPTRPGLVLYGGPWGDGGGAAERAYARVYAAKGMAVFLPDYFTETCGDTNATTLMTCLNYYFGGFLGNSTYAQRIALLAYTTLRSQSIVDSGKIGAMGFCFGGAMALQAARAGAEFEVAVSLHGEYPGVNTVTPAPWATKYFVEMIGYDDPFIPLAGRTSWMDELANATRGTTNTGEVQIWLNAVHAFSIQYSDTFLGILESQFPGAARYQASVAAASFDKIDYLFEEYGLINARTFPANSVVG